MSDCLTDIFMGSVGLQNDDDELEELVSSEPNRELAPLPDFLDPDYEDYFGSLHDRFEAENHDLARALSGGDERDDVVVGCEDYAVADGGLEQYEPMEEDTRFEVMSNEHLSAYSITPSETADVRSYSTSSSDVTDEDMLLMAAAASVATAPKAPPPTVKRGRGRPRVASDPECVRVHKKIYQQKYRAKSKAKTEQMVKEAEQLQMQVEEQEDRIKQMKTEHSILMGLLADYDAEISSVATTSSDVTDEDKILMVVDAVATAPKALPPTVKRGRGRPRVVSAPEGERVHKRVYQKRYRAKSKAKKEQMIKNAAKLQRQVEDQEDHIEQMKTEHTILMGILAGDYNADISNVKAQLASAQLTGAAP